MNWNTSLAGDVAALKGGGFDAPRTSNIIAEKASFVGRMRRMVRSPAFIFFVMVALSLPMRLVNLKAPFSGEHEFRQTQTALSVWDMRQYGLSLLHPRLPLFGPPWECPFEYPVFQIVAAVLDSIAPWTNLDVSIRVTNLLFFYLTTVMLALFARLLFLEWQAALFTTGAFLFSPYNTFWSRASMIEYAATFFGLAYLLVLVRWTFKPERRLFALALCLGILASLTKTTSFAIPLITAGTIAGLNVLNLIRHYRSTSSLFVQTEFADKLDNLKEAPEPLKGSFGAIHAIALAMLLIVPVVTGYSYTLYGDHIKSQLPYTALLSLSQPAMKRWTYGTWAQRLSWHNWARIFQRIEYVNMRSSVFAVVIGFCALPFCTRRFVRLPRGNFWIGASLALAPLIGIAVFFNLYVIHTYYLIACAPFLALFAGVGLSLVFKFAQTRFLQVLFVLGLLGLVLQEWSGRLGSLFSSTTVSDQRVAYLSDAARFINKDEPVIVLSSSGWSAFAPYYLKRRAFMAVPFSAPPLFQPLLDQHFFKNNGFRWLLTEGDNEGMSLLTTQITNQWKFARVVPLASKNSAYVLYSLTDE